MITEPAYPIWIDVLLPGGELAFELLSEALTDLGAKGLRPEDDRLHVYFAPEDWSEAVPRRLEEVLRPLVEEGLLPEGEIRIEDAPWEDWIARWRNRLGPIRAGARFVIVPPVIDYAPHPGDRVLELEPRMAFGTGEHPTTRMALALLEELEEPAERVIDLGCGNGVLALGALMLDAGCAVCIDNEQEAVDETTENLIRHGYATRFSVTLGDAVQPTVDGRFGLILANILCLPVLEGLPHWTRFAEPGATCILTGIQSGDEEQRVREKATALGWTETRALHENGWYAGRFTLSA